MNNIEQNALRIAELMGYKKVLDAYSVNGQSWNRHKIATFSSYEGLMPILFECNSKSPNGNILNISIYYSSVVLYVDSERKHTYWYNTESKFIEALQLACIKYLELKNEH